VTATRGRPRRRGRGVRLIQWDLSAVGDDQAQAADARMAPEVFGAPVWHQPSVGGAHVTSFLGDRVARVVSPAGHRGLVVSSVPLHSSAGGQGDKPVDLTVQDRGSMFAPANPTVPTTVPKQTSGELSLGELRIRPGADRLSTGRVVDGRVLYPNSARDTDVAVGVLPTGIETFTLLRSPAAPRSLGLGLGLGAGERLVTSDAPGGGFDVVRDDQQRVAHIPQPTATDAEGSPVAVRTAVSASGLGLTVDATAKDTAWPVSVDPAVYYDFNTRQEGAGWGNYTAGGAWAFWGLQNGAGGWGYGLYTYAGGGFPGAPAAVGEWNYYGEFYRSSTAYVYAAEMRSYFSAGYGACRYAGIYNGTWEAGNDYYSNTCSSVNAKADAWCVGACDPTTTTATAPNYAVFGTQATVYNANSFINYLQAANVYIGDHEPPTATASGLPPGWVQDTGYQVTGSDTGVGVNNLSATGTASWTSGCSVDPDNHCPANQTITATTNTLPEGINNINANATDVIGSTGHTFNSTIGQVRIDRSPPAIALSGTLSDGATISHDSTLNVAATDGSNDGNPADARSGVASVDLTLDSGTPNSQQLEHVTQGACQGPGCPPSSPAPCTTLDNCSLSATYQAQLAGLHNDIGLADGPHTITITATDNMGAAGAAGHSTTQTISFFSETNGPSTTLGGTLWGHQDQTLSDPSYNLRVDASAGDTADPGSGIKTIDIAIDGHQDDPPNEHFAFSCPITIGNCDQSASWNFIPARFGPGDHVITVTTQDQAGLTTVDSETVTSRILPTLPPDHVDQTNAPFQIIGDNGEAAGSSVADIGDVNGDGLDDYLIGAPGAGLSTNTKANSGSAYVVYGQSNDAPVDLAHLTPQQGFRIDGASVGDAAGTAVAALGDVNGDGIPDFAIGAPATGLASLVGVQLPPLLQGHVYVIFGSKCSTANAPDPSCQSSTTNANIDLANLGNRGYTINGPALPSGLLQGTGNPTPHFGSVIGTLPPGAGQPSGDVNNDGLNDVVIGSPDENPGGVGAAGSAYVIYGKTDSGAESIDGGGYNGFRIDGATANDHAGRSAAIIGDTNGDDNADVVIGAPGHNASDQQPGGPVTRTSAGSAYVVYGGPSSTVSLAGLESGSSAGYPIHGAPNDNLGTSVAALGDQLGSGHGDFVLGGSGAYVLYGSQDDTQTLDLTEPPGTLNGYRVNSPTDSGTTLGNAVVSGGVDLNADGEPDLLLSYPTAANSNGPLLSVFSQQGADIPSTPVQLSIASSPGQLLGQVSSGSAGDQTASSQTPIDNAGDGNPGYMSGNPNAAPQGRSGAGRVVIAHASSFADYNVNSAASTASGPCRRLHEYEFSGTVPACRLSAGAAVKDMKSTVVHFGYKPPGRGKPRGYPNGLRNKSAGPNAHARLSGNKLAQATTSRGGTLMADGHTTAWPITDSFGNQPGHVLEYVEMEHRNILDVFSPSTKARVARFRPAPPDDPRGAPYPYVELSGRGCMSSYGNEDAYALVAVRTPKTFESDGQRVDARGFIPRNAFRVPNTHFLRDASATHSEDIRAVSPDEVIDQWYSRCDLPYRRSGATRTASTISRPFFRPEESYVPGTGAPIALTNYEKIAAYNTGAPDNPAHLPDSIVLADSSSAVSAGGITRAVASNGTPTTVLSTIGYRDPNVRCWDGSPTNLGVYAALWNFASLNTARPIRVWYPTRSVKSGDPTHARRYSGPSGGTDLSCMRVGSDPPEPAGPQPPQP